MPSQQQRALHSLFSGAVTAPPPRLPSPSAPAHAKKRTRVSSPPRLTAAALSFSAPHLTSSYSTKAGEDEVPDSDDDDDDVPLSVILFDASDTAPYKKPRILSPGAEDKEGVQRLVGVCATSPLLTPSLSAPLLAECAAERVGRRRAPSPAPCSTRHLTQTTLDLGQRGSTGIGQQCPLCGMIFNQSREDITLHTRFCRAEQRRQRTRNGGGKTFKRERSLDVHIPPLGTTDLSSSRKAVELVEALLGVPIVVAPPPHRSHSSAAAAGGGAAASASMTSPIKKRTRRSCTADCAASSSSPLLSSRMSTACRSLSCVQLPPVMTAASPHPLVVVVVAVHPPTSTTIPAAATAAAAAAVEAESTTLMHLLGLLGFTRYLRAPPTHHCSSGSSSVDQRESDTVAAMTYIFVMDATLRLLLCGVAGHVQQREQDPELCVRQRDDGSTVCGTLRQFTRADVTDCWQLSVAALRKAQKEWETRTAAPFASSGSALKRFFKLSNTSVASAQDSSCDGGVAQRLSRLALGVAVCSLARWLVYGQRLCPVAQLSYAHSVLRCCREHHEEEEDDDEGGDDGEGAGDVMYAALCAAAPLYTDSAICNNAQKQMHATAEQLLYEHEDAHVDDENDGEMSDGDITAALRRGTLQQQQQQLWVPASSSSSPPRSRSPPADRDRGVVVVVGDSDDGQHPFVSCESEL